MKTSEIKDEILNCLQQEFGTMGEYKGLSAKSFDEVVKSIYDSIVAPLIEASQSPAVYPSDEEIEIWAFKNTEGYPNQSQQQAMLIKGAKYSRDLIGSLAIEFAEWINKNRYSIYFGNEGENCGKWYVQYSQPNRIYYTTSDLFKLFLEEKQKS